MKMNTIIIGLIALLHPAARSPTRPPPLTGTIAFPTLGSNNQRSYSL